MKTSMLLVSNEDDYDQQNHAPGLQNSFQRIFLPTEALSVRGGNESSRARVDQGYLETPIYFFFIFFFLRIFWL